MNNDKFILVYDLEGKFIGFYDDISVVNSICNNTDYKYNYITNEIHDYILNMYMTPQDNIIDISKVTNGTIIDSNDYIIEHEIAIDIDKIKIKLISDIKQKCNEFIVSGIMVELSNGDTKLFTYKLEDQINLESIIKNYSETDMIYYHAANEYDTLYTYKDMVMINSALYNNKIYNLIYTQVLCDWIMDNYSKSLYDNKIIISYGYSNDYILEKVGEIYEQQKLHK